MEARRHASSFLASLPSSWRSCDVLLRNFATIWGTQPASVLHAVSPSSAPVLTPSQHRHHSTTPGPHDTTSQAHPGPDSQAHRSSRGHPATTAAPQRAQSVVPRSQQQHQRGSNIQASSSSHTHHLQTHRQPADGMSLQRSPRWGVSAPQQITGRMSASVSLQDLAANVTRHEHVMNLFSTTAAITRLARLREEYQSLHGQTVRPPRPSPGLTRLSPLPNPFSVSSIEPQQHPSADLSKLAPLPDAKTVLQQQFDTDLNKLARRLVDLLEFCLGQDSTGVPGKSGLQSSQLPLLSQCLWALSRLCGSYPELKTLAAPLVHLLHKPAFFYSFEDHPPEVLAKTVWAVVKLQMEDHLQQVTVRDILAQLATAATTRINDTNELGCTLLVRGLAKQRLKHASLFKAVANRGADVAETFTPTHLAKTLWAYATLYPPAPSSPAALHDALQPQDPHEVLAEIQEAKSDPNGSRSGRSSGSGTGKRMFDGESSPNLSTGRDGNRSHEGSKGAAASGKVGRDGQGRDGLENAKAVHLVESFERLYQSLADKASVQLPMFKPVDLSTLLWACAKLGVVHSRLWERAGGAVLLSLYRCDNQALVDIAWAYARIGRREEAVLQPLAQQATRRLYRMSAMEVSKLASSFGTLQLFPPALFSAIRSEAGIKLHLMTITDLQYILPAMRQDPGCDAPLLQQLTSQLAVMRQARDSAQARQELAS